MPLERLVCYCDSCKGEADLPVDEVLDHAAQRRGGRFTYELLSAMVAQVQDRGDRISTTTLTNKCDRGEVLKRFGSYTDDPAKLYASFRGTMFHGQLELHAHPDSIAEARFHINLPRLGPFSGSPDLLDVNAGNLYDYKFTKEVPRFEYAWKDHVHQMQVNRWLVDHADWVEWQDAAWPLSEDADIPTEKPLACTDVEENQRRFRPVDWQGLYVIYMDDRGPKPILLTKSIEVPKKSNPDEMKKVRVADIWDDDRVEDFVFKRYREVKTAFDPKRWKKGVVPPIPETHQGWDHPLCPYCPVKSDCVTLFVNDQVEVALRLERKAS